jgi:hypothetical protein
MDCRKGERMPQRRKGRKEGSVVEARSMATAAGVPHPVASDEMRNSAPPFFFGNLRVFAAVGQKQSYAQ